MARQPKVSTTQPPKDGPTAGDRAQMSEATPIIMPMRLRGACSKMILNISGKAMPVPMPCKSLPTRSTVKVPANAPRSVPPTKRTLAVKKRRFMTKRAFKKADKGMMTASMRRYPVVTH